MNIRVSDVAGYLNTTFEGDDILITGISSIFNIKSNTLCFVKNKQNVYCNKPFLLLAPKGYKNSANNSIILVDNPRLSYAKVVSNFLAEKEEVEDHKTAMIHSTATIGKGSCIGVYSSIGKNVKIGNNTIIKNNVHIDDNVFIGDNCYIKSNTVVGESGFGFVFDNKIPFKVPHLGSVIIGNNVEVGANCTIARGTIEHTIIDNHVKIDDHVHVAHNCRIGAQTVITAHALLSGSVTIGELCWIGPNSSIIHNTVIKKNSLIGIGSIVTKDLPEGSKVMGLHAITLRLLGRFKKLYKYGSK